MRATFLAGGKAIEHGVVDNVRSIDLAPTAAFLLDIPVPQHSQGEVLLDLLERGDSYTPVNVVGLTDFHGQLEAASTTIVGRNTLAGEIAALSVGGAGQLATLFDAEAASLPGQSVLLASGDNVGASPPNSALLEDKPAIDVENVWGLDATSLGNHEFDFGVERTPAAPGTRQLPVPRRQHRRDRDRRITDVVAKRRPSSRSTGSRSASSAPTSRTRQSW